MNKKYKDGRLRLHFIILGFIIISTFFLSIGYATFESITLDINGQVTAVPQSDIYISNAEYSTNVNADTENSIIHQYYQTTLYNTVILGNSANSSITYNITMYNNSDVTYTFNSVQYKEEFYDNLNIVYELEGLKKGDLLLSKQQLTFSIKFHYMNNVVPNNNILNSYLNFKFVKGTNPAGVPDINNIVTNANKIMIYNAEKDKVLIDITNNNYAPMNLNLMIEDNIIDTISIEPQQSKILEKSIKGILGKLQTNKEYEVIIKQVESDSQVKASGVKIQVFPTITNYDFGLRTDGTEENPYLINQIEDITRLAQNVNTGNTFANIYIKQIKDLDFTNSEFTMIGMQAYPFQGIYDGDNKRIDNISITDTTENNKDNRMGFFRYISNATIKNLTLSGNYNIINDCGGFVGGAIGNCNILNCHNYINITNSVSGFSAGGILGYLTPSSNVLIDNCSNNANITNVDNTGGLVGLVHSSVLTLTNGKNTGTVTANIAGGLVSKDNSGGATIIIRNSQNSGEVRGKTYAGAFVGNMSQNGSLTPEGCTNTGNIIIGTTSKSASSSQQSPEATSIEETPIENDETIDIQDDNIEVQNEEADITIEE